jgi:hypothetical protein
MEVFNFRQLVKPCRFMARVVWSRNTAPEVTSVHMITDMRKTPLEGAHKAVIVLARDARSRPCMNAFHKTLLPLVLFSTTGPDFCRAA